MEKIILVKDDKKVEIEVRKYKGIYFLPLAYIFKRKLWNQLFPSIATTLLIFPAFMHRIWLVNSIWEEQVRTLLDKGYQPWDEDSYEVLKKHTIVPSLDYLDTDRYVYITNGSVMRQIQTKAPKGYKEWISFYNQAWENKMYWIGFTSAFMLITGLGDVVFSFVALSRGGKWQWNKWSKKGYKPYTNVDRMKIENDQLKRTYDEVEKEVENNLEDEIIDNVSKEQEAKQEMLATMGDAIDKEKQAKQEMLATMGDALDEEKQIEQEMLATMGDAVDELKTQEQGVLEDIEETKEKE